MWDCLGKAGIADKIRSLPKGIDTPMNKQFDADAADFSGGEMQKLLLARAIYHDASILILDEPTAALDAIAENRIYQNYQELTEHATSVFISHRLASTRFCDRIYLLDGARLAESGTHEELMALGGRYRELFDIQSKYYKEGGDSHEE
jgi:ATP-binding cassette subfamily B protein